MIHPLAWKALVMLSISLSGCANFQTVSRQTTLPLPNESGGLAIHLDAQQRLVVVSALGRYCAEPSPDALAAYASSLGLGISAPTQGAASLAQALQSSAGSIGLRTQSITLMRDALYRMCEAYSNGAIEPIQLVSFLSRSQDLTAVVLAIEQLTGAVAASQVVLTGSAGSGASASLLANQQLLDAARKDEQAKTKSLQDAKEERDTTKKSADDKRLEAAIAKDAHQQATAPNSTTSDAKRAELEADWHAKKSDLRTLESNLAASESQIKTKEALLAESRRTRETIENLRESALTNAVANTTGAGEFSAPVQRNELSKDATLTIANAVQGMVEKVLDKTYTEDTCMALISSSPKDFDKWSADRRENYKDVQDLCTNLVSAGLLDAINIKKTKATFRPDTATPRIKKALENDSALRGQMNEWLTSQSLGISTTMLIYGNEYADLRQKAIKELSIP